METVGGDALRKIMGRFPTGVTVVTAQRDGEQHGMTLNSLTSVSLDPPLILVCLKNDSRTLWAVEGSGTFAINFLHCDQKEVSNAFARPGADRSEAISGLVDQSGFVLIPGRIAHLGCRVTDIHPGGDHQIVVAEVVEGVIFTGHPLVFYMGKYHDLGATTDEREVVWYS